MKPSEPGVRPRRPSADQEGQCSCVMTPQAQLLRPAGTLFLRHRPGATALGLADATDGRAGPRHL